MRIDINISTEAKNNAKKLADEYGIGLSELVRMLLRDEDLRNRARKLKLKTTDKG